MSPVTILSSDLPVRLNALSGQVGIHLGSPPHLSHIKGLCVDGSTDIAPNLHASTHQQQPLHFVSSTVMVPVFFDCVNASSGQAATQGAFIQALHVTAKLKI